MEINSIQGINAYTSARPADTNIPAQNPEAAQTDLNQDSSRVAQQQAFEVTITEEARAQQAQETASSEEVAANPQTEPPQPPEQDQQQSQAAAQQPQAPPIVDIVA